MGDQGASLAGTVSVPCCPECRQQCEPSRISRPEGGSVLGLTRASFVDEPVLACPCGRLELRSGLVLEAAEVEIAAYLSDGACRELAPDELVFLRKHLGLDVAGLAKATRQSVETVRQSEGEGMSVLAGKVWYLLSDRVKELVRERARRLPSLIGVRSGQGDRSISVDMAGIGLDGLPIVFLGGAP